MSKGTSIAGFVLVCFVIAGLAVAGELSDNWNDFLHYTKIGRLDLAKGYAQALIDSDPDPVAVLDLAEDNPNGLYLLQKANDNEHDRELAELAGKVLDIIEQGRFARRTDPAIIAEEIRRLSDTARGQLAAIKRLKNAGEYAIPFMLDAMADVSRRAEVPNIVLAMPQIGKDAIRPLAAALQTDNTAVRAEIIKALGEIGYPQSLGYLKYVVENDSSAELRKLAAKSIQQIKPAASRISAAELFYQLGEDYYNHIESLAPAEDADFANMWFWDEEGRRLVREPVDREYFYELMAMRCCEWALRADAELGKAIGLWIAAFFKAESTGLEMPEYFGAGHADAMTYATTAGAEYLHQALARAIKDDNAYVALQSVEALAVNAGEKSLMYRFNMQQPLLAALSFNDKAVRYSAAIAIAAANPQTNFAENRIVVQNLAQALAESSEASELDNADEYALRAANAMLKLAVERNRVIDLSGAQDALMTATTDKRDGIKILSAKVLAHLSSADAQRSITAMALNESNPMDIRLSAFDSLITSAKVNGNLLDDAYIGAIYSLVSSNEIDTTLRSSAASAYGALNLPSQKVRNLILDQAKN
ncbi:MAG: HEAT repeat domain-containing protein [Phycisphaerales bacterium]|jgi:HEAT repeat protein